MTLSVFLQLGICLVASVVSAVLSVIAVVLYSVDIEWNHRDQCDKLPCDDRYQQHATVSINLLLLNND